jgi:hypothetical protein
MCIASENMVLSEIFGAKEQDGENGIIGSFII